MKKIIYFIPIITLIIICLFVLIYILSEKSPNKPPSALIDKDLPIFSSNNLYNKEDYLSNLSLSENFVLINFFASWCTPCKLEHHLFFEIKKEFPNLFLLGINHKDKENDAKKYLSEEGNPYSFVAIDPNGKLAIEFGVFGLPETFLINDKGKIIYKHIGPITTEIIYEKIKPLL
tara:strand:+ start:642 stop:1166 length:525 start_codon:yes stop_codon:yes gene_type:complete